MFEPCEVCGTRWLAGHKADCRKAADQFLTALEKDRRATSDHEPRCPKCGLPDANWTDAVSCRRPVCDGDDFPLTCPHCEHEYTTRLSITYHFHVE